MQIINGPSLRRLIPAGAVAAVLAFSYMAQVPTLASSAAGYGNNCGVKGTGYHDHGKVCPNRPFPGHGNGVLRILGSSFTPFESSGTVTVRDNGKKLAKVNASTTGLVNGNTADVDSDNIGNSGKNHSRGKGHGYGKAQANTSRSS